MNSDTPRTDNVAGDGTTVPADFAADLEREVTAAKAEVERLRANRDFWHQACLQAQEHRDGANASNAVWEAETVKLRAEVEMLRAALKTAKWMLERDYIDDQKMAVIRKCEAALGEPK